MDKQDAAAAHASFECWEFNESPALTKTAGVAKKAYSALAEKNPEAEVTSPPPLRKLLAWEMTTTDAINATAT
jgi:hypothetical protein